MMLLFRWCPTNALAFSALMLFAHCGALQAQEPRTAYVDQTTLVTSQLGFRPQSPKTVTLLPSVRDSLLPAEIPFYVDHLLVRMKREQDLPKAWTGAFFDWPFDIDKGKYTGDRSGAGIAAYRGTLKKITSRWGTFYQGDFTAFTEPGIYQIETEYGFTTPFVIERNPYARLVRSYLNYLRCQRSGTEVPGIRPLENADDGVLDTDGTYVPAAGGWNDAGDFRKWISQTSSHIEALSLIAQHAGPAYKNAATDEIAWGNKFFQAMITPEGRVYEDIGSGALRGGKNYQDDWWCENHAGCLGSGEGMSDNIKENGDERKIRTTYNPVCQFLFIRNQVIASRVLDAADAMKCEHLAELGWKYSQIECHDGRTLFVAEELLAACELFASGLGHVSADAVERLAGELMTRQETGDVRLNGYFYEKGKTDGYRSIVWNAEPAMALLRVTELNIPSKAELTKRTGAAVKRYIENYILRDAASNPFSVTPYGVFVKPAHSDEVTFRDAGGGNFVRTVHQSAQRAGDGARNRRRADASCIPPRARRPSLEKRSLPRREREAHSVGDRP